MNALALVLVSELLELIPPAMRKLGYSFDFSLMKHVSYCFGRDSISFRSPVTGSLLNLFVPSPI